MFWCPLQVCEESSVQPAALSLDTAHAACSDLCWHSDPGRGPPGEVKSHSHCCAVPCQIWVKIYKPLIHFFNSIHFGDFRDGLSVWWVWLAVILTTNIIDRKDIILDQNITIYHFEYMWHVIISYHIILSNHCGRFWSFTSAIAAIPKCKNNFQVLHSICIRYLSKQVLTVVQTQISKVKVLIMIMIIMSILNYWGPGML